MARLNALADVAKGLKANIYVHDNLSPVSRVAVYVKAGTRYEPDYCPGLAAHLRASSCLTNTASSVFGITRHIERAGAKLQVQLQREYMVYRVSCLRDQLSYVLGFVDDILHRQEFRSWELVDYTQPRLEEELKMLRKNQLFLTNEALHKAAYRGGLAHATLIPEHQIAKINRNDLLGYVEKNFVLDRMSFTGLGVDENELRGIVDDHFKLNGSQYAGVDGATRYVGGEARIQAGFPNTMVSFVVQGSPIIDSKRIACLEIIGTILGGDTQVNVKYGIGAPKSLNHLLSTFSHGFSSRIVNINHSDTGLFGFSILGPNQKLKEAVKASIMHVRRVMSELKETDLKVAKRTLKARSLINNENQEAVFDFMCKRHAAGLTNQGILEFVDKLTLKDIQDTVASLMKSKPTLVSIGNPRFVPYIDELD